MVREPVVAGQFYPDSPPALRRMIEGFVDKTAEKPDVVGLVSPHAGYMYSGAVAGAALSRVRFPETFILIGPNHTGAGAPFAIMTEGTWRTPLGDVAIDTGLARKLLDTSAHLQEDALAHQHEHSLEVQLPFLQYFKSDVKIVPITLGFTEGGVYRDIGRELARAVRETGRDVVILASSDMTHYESAERARQKDTQAIDAILALDEEALLERVEKLNISMCGYAPAVSMLVAARELGAGRAELVSYRNSGDASGDYRSVVGYAGLIVARLSPPVRLAKETVETFIRERRSPAPPAPLPPELQGQAGTFVSIHKKGELRGCIGTVEPSQANIAQEIITNAISAATRDPRFPPITPGELKDLDYSVDILTAPEPVSGKEELDPKKYGAIVECDWRRGLLLPDLEGVDTADFRVDICCQKAGIAPGEPYRLYRFEVKRYK